MNIVLGIILFIATIFLSYMISDKYTLKKRFYNDFYTFNDVMIREVSFSNASIIKILDTLNRDSDFHRLADGYFNKKNREKLKYLQDDEIINFYSYLNSIGSTDKESQLNLLQSTKEQLSDIVTQCELDEKKYKKLYIKLGILIGLIILVVCL